MIDAPAMTAGTIHLHAFYLTSCTGEPGCQFKGGTQTSLKTNAHWCYRCECGETPSLNEGG